MPFVRGAGAFAGDRERLARAGSRPQLPFFRPAGEARCETPSTDSGEEVALHEAFEVFGLDISDAPRVDEAVGKMPGSDQVAEPLRGVGLELVVVVRRVFLVVTLACLFSFACSPLHGGYRDTGITELGTHRLDRGGHRRRSDRGVSNSSRDLHKGSQTDGVVTHSQHRQTARATLQVAQSAFLTF